MTSNRNDGYIRYSLTLRRLHVEGFKSLRDVTLELGDRNPVVLVGANGSGKTNVVELFLFMRRALHDELVRRPYAPHAEWGSPRNLTWEATGAPIRVELEYRFSAERDGDHMEDKLIYTVVFAPDPAFTVIRPVYEKIEMPGLGYELERSGKRLETKLKAENNNGKLHRQLRECCREASIECGDEWCRVVQQLEGENGDSDIPPVLVAPSAFVLRTHSEKGINADLVVFAGCCFAVIPFPFNKFKISAGTILSLLDKWFEGIVVLRQVDYGVAKWPHNRYSDRTLRPRAENLAEILYRVMGNPEGRERVEAAMATLFPWLEVRVEFNEYGQIGLVFYEKRGEKSIRLYPSMVPDGVVKMLAILAARALKPSVLAIDEVENSLHAALIDYLIGELEDMDDPVILATHSPIVVDLAGPERTLLLRRAPDGSTRVEKLAPRKLWEKLRDEGLSLSDYYLHAAT